jgi:hypothetical protein
VWGLVRQDGAALIRVLVKGGAKLNASNLHNYGWHSPLHEAARRRRVANCRLLAELGADPESRDGGGLTPMEYVGAGSAVAKAIKVRHYVNLQARGGVGGPFGLPFLWWRGDVPPRSADALSPFSKDWSLSFAPCDNAGFVLSVIRRACASVKSACSRGICTS